MTENVNRNLPPELSDDDAELLSAYLDDMLTTAERETLETRLANDAFLRAELQAMRRTVEWLNDMPQLKAPRNFTISAETAAQEPPRNVTLMPRRNLWLSAAAVVVVLFGVVFVAGTLLNSPMAEPPADAAQDTGAPSIQIQGDAVAAQLTDTATVTSTLQPTQNPANASIIVAATAGVGAGLIPTASQIAPQTLVLSTATPQLADITVAGEEAESDDEAARGTLSDTDEATQQAFAEEQAAESGIAQAVVVEATQTAVIALATTPLAPLPRMTATALPSPTAMPSLALENTSLPATDEASASGLADGQVVELSSVEATATSLALLFSTPTGATTFQQQGGQEGQPTEEQPLPTTETGSDTPLMNSAAAKEPLDVTIRRIVWYLFLGLINYLRTQP